MGREGQGADAIKFRINDAMAFTKGYLIVFHVLQEQYVYDTGGFKGEAKKSGQRLVGADKADHETIPFIVAWTLEADDKIEDAQCTG